MSRRTYVSPSFLVLLRCSIISSSSCTHSLLSVHFQELSVLDLTHIWEGVNPDVLCHCPLNRKCLIGARCDELLYFSLCSRTIDPWYFLQRRISLKFVTSSVRSVRALDLNLTAASTSCLTHSLIPISKLSSSCRMTTT